MGVDRKGERRRLAALGASLVLVALACLRPQPSGEGAPSSAPVTSATPAPEAPAPESVQAEPAEPEAAPAGSAGADLGVRAAPPPPTAPAAPSKPKEQKASARKSSSAALSSTSDEEPAADDLRRRLLRAYAASSPDCPSARDRKKAVCDLATQICSLTERDPNVASVAEYCEGARRRCNDAERKTSQRCPD